MTNQQKYAELREEYDNLAATIVEIDKDRNLVWDKMCTIANSFDDCFYYRVGDKVLYRADRTTAIQLRKFDK